MLFFFFSHPLFFFSRYTYMCERFFFFLIWEGAFCFCVFEVCALIVSHIFFLCFRSFCPMFFFFLLHLSFSPCFFFFFSLLLNVNCQFFFFSVFFLISLSRACFTFVSFSNQEIERGCTNEAVIHAQCCLHVFRISCGPIVSASAWTDFFLTIKVMYLLTQTAKPINNNKKKKKM